MTSPKPTELLSKKESGYTFRVGRWGVFLLPKDPGGRVYRLVSFMPLDNWITDPKEVERIMREKGLEL